jgi:hypothetical protein
MKGPRYAFIIVSVFLFVLGIYFYITGKVAIGDSYASRTGQGGWLHGSVPWWALIGISLFFYWLYREEIKKEKKDKRNQDY